MTAFESGDMFRVPNTGLIMRVARTVGTKIYFDASDWNEREGKIRVARDGRELADLSLDVQGQEIVCTIDSADVLNISATELIEMYFDAMAATEEGRRRVQALLDIEKELAMAIFHDERIPAEKPFVINGRVVVVDCRETSFRDYRYPGQSPIAIKDLAFLAMDD